MGCSYRVSAFCLLALLGPPAAHAGLDVFTDRAAWEASVGTVSWCEDFEQFTQDVSFRVLPVDVGGRFTLVQQGATMEGTRKE